mgnify:CR=1 FL=1
MINAVGGVDLCIPQDVDDPYTSLQLTKGLHHLDGHQATQYARTAMVWETDPTHHEQPDSNTSSNS